jgi:hypothetical protein
MRAALVGAAVASAALAALASAACGNDHAQPGAPDAGIASDDPLNVADQPPEGSLDWLHQTIIAKRCSGQPGLCHNGQFEPNLSTPAMTYAYLVNRPGIEKPNALRVKAGDSAHSLFIDKIRNRGVATQMPLGAEPLDESDIKALEAWIDAGALRAPGAAAAPDLDNPPHRPEIAIYQGASRLDGTGPVHIAVGAPLVLRHSVQDFETPDAQIPFAGVLLQAADGRAVALSPAASDPSIGQTTYDAAGPMGIGDQLDYQRAWTVPATLTLWDRTTNVRTDVPASGQTLTVIAIYIDGATPGIAAFDASASQIQIQ